MDIITLSLAKKYADGLKSGIKSITYEDNDLIFILEDNSFDGSELDLAQEVEQYFKEDIYWLIEHIDMPDELVDEANSLNDSQIKELNEDLINRFDSSISNLLEEKLLNV